MRSKSRLFATVALSALPITAFAEDFVNTGDIVSDVDGIAISNPENNSTLTNSGDITATGNGILIEDAIDFSIDNSATIEASAGIIIDNADTATITNSGHIDVSSQRGGIGLVDVDTIVIDNTGSIDGSIATRIENADTVDITNSGSLESHLAAFDLEDVTTVSIDNSGFIDASRFNVYSEGAETFALNNTGSMIAGGDSINLVDPENVSIDNSGLILADGIGISLENGETFTLNNSGTIEANGGFASSGIETYEVNEVTINNTGSISGSDWGIYVEGSDIVTINNSGTIAGDLYAISTSAPLNLNLFAGSVIDGVIDARENVLSVGDGLTTTLEFYYGSLPAEITVADGVYTIDGYHVYVIDNDFATSVTSGLAPQLGQLTNLLEFRTPSAPEVSRGAAGGGAWGDATVSGFRDDGLSGYALTGLMGWEMASGRGVMLGGGLSRSEARSAVGTELDTKYLVGGLYGTWGAADYAVFGGLSRTDATQIISGSEETASYTSLFLAPSLSFDGQIGTADTNLRLTYAVQKSGSHSYGTALTVDDQINHLVDVKASAAYDIGNGFQAYYGANGRYGAGNAVDVLFDDVALTTDSTSEFSARGFVGLKNDMFDLELGRDTNGRNDVRLTVSVAF